VVEFFVACVNIEPSPASVSAPVLSDRGLFHGGTGGIVPGRFATEIKN